MLIPSRVRLEGHAQTSGFPDLSAFLRARYVDAQASGLEIAEEVGIHSNAVYAALAGAGIARRRRDYRRVVAARARTREGHRQARAQLHPPAGFSTWSEYLAARRNHLGRLRMTQLREELGLTESTIRLLAEEHLGIPLPPTFRWRTRAEAAPQAAAP